MTVDTRDFFSLAWGAVIGHRLRSALTMLGIVIGIASVILLTSLGEGTRLYILSEFTQFGTNLLQVTPGRITTLGMPGAIGGTIRKLTIDDGEALLRVPGVEKVVPVSFGMARVAAGERGRSVFIYGVTSDVPDVWKFQVRQGRFLPPGDHPARIHEWCVERGITPPETPEGIVRCVLESLALKYRAILENLRYISGQPIGVIHIVGGGAQNQLLNQFTADATGIPVIAGPTEATVLGNAAVQLIALGELGSIADARQIIARMNVTQDYQPTLGRSP